MQIACGALLLIGPFQNCSPLKSAKLLTQASSSSSSSTGASFDTVTNYKFSCTDQTQRGLSEADGRRLTRDELFNTFHDLLGDSIYNSLQSDLLTLPGDAIKDNVTEFKPLYSDAHVQALLTISSDAADLIVDNQANLNQFVSECAPAGGGNVVLATACVQKFISDFGLKVMRRPLTNDEVTSYANFYAQGTDSSDGLKLVIMRFLQSPAFLFLIEQGSGQTSGGRTRLTDYEIASRLSYRLTGTMPDDQLFAAASRGELQSLDNLQTQAQRLIQKPNMHDRVDQFFNYYAKLNDFPAFVFTPNYLGMSMDGLRDEIIQETRDYFDYITWTANGSVKDLYSSQAAFPKTDRVAQIYGSAKMTGTAPVMLGADRAGFLLRPGFLAGGSDGTSPIMRGVAVRRRFLCDDLPSPSADIVNSRLQQLGALDPTTMSNRDIFTTVTSPQLCMSCHSMINPIGFTFESYDGLGRKRTVEQVFNAQTDTVIATHPIDTQVDGLEIDNTTAISISDASQLSATVANSVKAPACFAQHIYRFTRMRNETANDNCALSDMERALRDSGGSIIGAFIRNVANEDIFWKKSI